MTYRYFINGPLPPEWGAWTELEVFECEGCGLTGGIPSTWSAHEKIVKLDLSDNELTGSHPDWWDKTPNLRELYLRDNLFTGPFPKSLGKVPSFGSNGTGGLWSLTMTGHNLRGCVPRSLYEENQFGDRRTHEWERVLPFGSGLHWCRN